MTTKTPQPPVIGISGAYGNLASVSAMMAQVRAAGAVPLFLENFPTRKAAEDIEKIDALIVLGNKADINPARYGEEVHPKTVVESLASENPAREEYEFELMQLALDKKMPLLGVCGGMQRLNVMSGGSLHQHVPDLVGHDEHNQVAHKIAPFVPVQPVLFAPGSRLETIGEGISSVFAPTHGTYNGVRENSIHHQAINRVGKGLRAAAHAEDELPDGGGRLIEAIEGTDPSHFVLGVQWHPEFGASPLGPKIIARLTGQAQRYAQAGNRTHPVHEAIDETIKSTRPYMAPSSHHTVTPGSQTGDILGTIAR